MTGYIFQVTGPTAGMRLRFKAWRLPHEVQQEAIFKKKIIENRKMITRSGKSPAVMTAKIG